MSVVVNLPDGTVYALDDEEGIQVAYVVLPAGGLAILTKENGKTLSVQREFSPSGYNWVEGKRYGSELKGQAGADGKLEFEAARIVV
jgi:hypothetical protein